MKPKVGRLIFNITDETHIVLIDQTGTNAGNYMKHIDFLRPDINKRLKTEFAKDSTLGRVIRIDHYLFIIARQHYMNKWTEERISFVQKIINDILYQEKENKFKTTSEYDFLNKEYSNLSFYDW